MATVLTGASVLAGCMTSGLLSDPTYKETVTAFLFSADGKHLVVLGQQYHYIFDLDDDLKRVLGEPYRPHLHTEFSGFVANGDAVTGRYLIGLPTGASDEDRQRAKADGFRAEKAHTALIMNGNLTGKRYRARDLQTAGDPQAFNRQYVVWVTEPQTSGQRVAKLLLTPVTLAADGALVLGGVMLLTIVDTGMKTGGGKGIQP